MPWDGVFPSPPPPPPPPPQKSSHAARQGLVVTISILACYGCNCVIGLSLHVTTAASPLRPTAGVSRRQPGATRGAQPVALLAQFISTAPYRSCTCRSLCDRPLSAADSPAAAVVVPPRGGSVLCQSAHRSPLISQSRTELLVAVWALAGSRVCSAELKLPVGAMAASLPVESMLERLLVTGDGTQAAEVLA